MTSHNKREQKVLKSLYEMQERKRKCNLFAVIFLLAGIISFFGFRYEIFQDALLGRLFFSKISLFVFVVSSGVLFTAGYVWETLLVSAEKT